MRIFHYTTKSSYNSIKTTGTINQSTPWTSTDCSYGNGWYFTDLTPDKCDMVIALQCWKDVNALNKIESYFEFEADISALTKCRENVFIVKNWDTSKIKYVKDGAIPNCPDRPCTKCQKGIGVWERFRKAMGF